jgi:membrane protein YqaA with SNARE-associated domain
MTRSVEEQAHDELAPDVPIEKKQFLLWRNDYVFLFGAIFLVTSLAFTFFYIDFDIADLRTYGYLGVFAISLIGSASIFLPMPSIAAVFGSGAILDPLLGIPAPILIGLVAGLGEALGEFTGYAAGYGGSAAIRDRPFYRVLKGWMLRNGSVTMFIFSAIPNPFFDLAGTVAGAARMPVWKFFLSVWGGKTLKDVLIAATGVASLGIIERLFE